MNRKGIMSRTLLAAGLLATITVSAQAQKLPAKKSIISALELANNYFMQKWPDPGASVTVTNATTGKAVTRTSHLWTRAVYYEGLMALYGVDPQQKYLDYAIDWSNKHQWSPRNGIVIKNADDQCCGQTYIDLYNLDPKPERIQNIKTCIDSVIASGRKGDWFWIDAIQMAMPIYAKLGVVYKNDG